MTRKDYPLQEDAASEEFMISQILLELDLPRYRAVSAANVIKTAFKSFKERQKIFDDDVDFVNWRQALRNSMFIYRKTGVPDEVVHKAATTIKAAYRGFYTRRYIKGIYRKTDIGDQVASRGVAGYSPKVQRAFDRLKIDPYNHEVLSAVIFLQYQMRKFLQRISANRVVRDVVESITRLCEIHIECGKTKVTPVPSCLWRE